MIHSSSEKLVKAIHRKARRKYLAQEKIRIVLEGQLYPVSPSWTKWSDCLREGFSSSLTEED